MTNRYLPTTLRRALEKAVKDARLIAEEGARDAIRRLGVADSKAPSYLNDDERELRRRLRAHARALGDPSDRDDETQETKRLVEAAAYACWHRMLFARFLAERSLLRNPDYDVPVSLEDCRELAEAEGLTDPWGIAERYAASMLPAVFRIDDPVLTIELDPVQAQELHRLVMGLDAEVFQAEDSLGWTYQFWRTAEKKAVNDSGMKIGADELPAVTQLFTEPYMVRFLLHNTLGAWWAGTILAADPMLARTAADENALRAACSLPGYSFDMLRFVREREDGPWCPSAGTFPGWPKEAKAITLLDPCCGSGHFLTEALAILAALRQAEEHLSPADAVAAVLRDNLHGLEIDGRCVQIAAFAVALSAWRIGGWHTLPLPHIAWVGSPPPLAKAEFTGLAEGDAELGSALGALFDLFRRAPSLGSLLDPIGGDLVDPRRVSNIEKQLVPLVEKARKAEPYIAEGTIAARGMADAAGLLSRTFTLTVTNPPFQTRQSLDEGIRSYLDRNCGGASADLSAAVMKKFMDGQENGSSIAFVIPSNLVYQPAYKRLRLNILKQQALRFMCRLGSGAFREISGEVVKVSLVCASRESMPSEFLAIDCAGGSVEEKERKLSEGQVKFVALSTINKLNDYRIVIDDMGKGRQLTNYFKSKTGTRTGDNPQFKREFWETSSLSEYRYLQSVPKETYPYGGRSSVMLWQSGSGVLNRYSELGIASIQGMDAWGQEGIAVGLMGKLPATIYGGQIYDMNTGVIYGGGRALQAALYAWINSGEYHDEIRKIDQQLKLTTATLLKVNFDIERWAKVAAIEYPDGLPQPFSDDPTQWLFHGHPANAAYGNSVHIALARLNGFRWPAETDPDMRLSDEARAWIAGAEDLPSGDSDGLLGVPAVAGEKPLADHLRAYLAAAFDADWSDALERRLVAEADETLDKKTARDGSLDAWVRDRAFRQHCALFGQHPFLWHISDGLKDGFSVFAHYHRLDQANLRKLTYTLLGDWLARAQIENNLLRYEKGRELQQKLEKILEGEKPYDIFVRWKSLAQQPMGWDPDLDDGVRQNIRPFILAGVLTHDVSKILKDKDRGKDVASAPWYDVFNGERRNDHHTTLAEKRAARQAAGELVRAAK